MKIKENVLLSTLTTMRLGGPARYVLEIDEVDEVRGAYTFAREKNLPVYVLGKGANSIATDEGFNGVILQNKIVGIEKVAEILKEFEFDIAPELEDSEIAEEITARLMPGEVLIRAFGGELWDDFVRYTTSLNLTGIEALAAIPSSVGAAPVQNIGAYGQDISETLFAVDVFDSKDFEYKTLFKDELNLSYRHSIFNTTEKNRYFIIAVYFKMSEGEISGTLYNSLQKYLDDNKIEDRKPEVIAEAVRMLRASKLPDPAVVASAGSFFKNAYVDKGKADELEEKGVPVRKEGTKYKVNTGYLVENCGLLGKNLHGFEINSAAALILINRSAKSYGELMAARDEIMEAVYNKYGIELEQEPVEIKTTGE